MNDVDKKFASNEALSKKIVREGIKAIPEKAI